jgi:hypothetical protein
MIELLDLTDHAPAKRSCRLRTALAWLAVSMAVLVIGLAVGTLTAAIDLPCFVTMPICIAIILWGFRSALYLAFR